MLFFGSQETLSKSVSYCYFNLILFYYFLKFFFIEGISTPSMGAPTHNPKTQESHTPPTEHSQAPLCRIFKRPHFGPTQDHRKPCPLLVTSRLSWQQGWALAWHRASPGTLAALTSHRRSLPVLPQPVAIPVPERGPSPSSLRSQKAKSSGCVPLFP